MSQEKKKSQRNRVPVLPLRDVIIFPHMVVPLFVGREKSINALEECVSRKQELFLVAQRQANVANPTEKDLFRIDARNDSSNLETPRQHGEGID